MQVPIGAENDFRGVVDLVEMKAYEWPDTLDADLPAINSKKGDPSLGQVQNEIPIPEDLADTVEEYRSKLVERSEEHTSELQSRGHLVCRLLLEKKKQKDTTPTRHHRQDA